MNKVKICTVCLTTIWMLNMFVLAVIELVYVHQYGQYMTCSSSIISMAIWLQIDAWILIGRVILFLLIILFGLCCITYDQESVGIIILLIEVIVFVLTFLFNCGWLIIGSVMFWRDCMTSSSLIINRLMYAVLIIGYINIFFQIVRCTVKINESR